MGVSSLRAIGDYLRGPTELEGRESLLGQPAPDFQMPDEEGNNVSLRRLTRGGPLLMHLYRGNW